MKVRNQKIVMKDGCKSNGKRAHDRLLAVTIGITNMTIVINVDVIVEDLGKHLDREMTIIKAVDHVMRMHHTVDHVTRIDGVLSRFHAGFEL